MSDAEAAPFLITKIKKGMDLASIGFAPSISYVNHIFLLVIRTETCFFPTNIKEWILIAFIRLTGIT
jgi:hypothetical protein